MSKFYIFDILATVGCCLYSKYLSLAEVQHFCIKFKIFTKIKNKKEKNIVTNIKEKKLWTLKFYNIQSAEI